MIAAFEVATDRDPANSWIVGQLVRLLLDQGELDRASHTVGRCAASRAWCLSLAGLVTLNRGAPARADSLFRSAEETMSADERCRWNDIGELLEGGGRQDYLERDCHERLALATRYWWLADPLFSVAGNERRTEHFARRMWVALHSALPRDERFHLECSLGGDALAQMVVRYGLPSYSYWMDSAEERSHLFGYVNRTSAMMGTAAHNKVDTALSISEYDPAATHLAAA